MTIDDLLVQADLTDQAYMGLPDHGWHFYIVIENWLQYARGNNFDTRIGILAARDNQFSTAEELRAAVLWSPSTEPEICESWFRSAPWRETAAPWETVINGNSYLEDFLCGRGANWCP